MKTDAAKAERLPEPPPRTIGRDELNLAEFPITALAHRIPDGCKELVFQDTMRDQATGEIITRKLTVTGDAKYGLPTPLDDDVIVALMFITKGTNNFTSRVVPFSRMAVVELLGWARNGQSLRRLDESLQRWLGVTLRYENAWWDKAAQTWVNESFHILDNITIYDQQTARRIKRNPAQTTLPLSTFAWNDVVFRSFQAENLKRLDLSLYFQLSLAPSKRAFRFLDKRFYRTPLLKFDLRNFACAKIGFSPDYTAAKIKEKLQPALDELEGVGFLAPLSRDKRYEKVSHGQWEIVLIRGEERKQPEIPAEAEPSEMPPLVAALVERGVEPDTAADLVRAYPEAKIQLQIELLDFRLAGKKADRIDDPAAYLVSAIRSKTGYTAPKGFTSRAERQRQEEARQARGRQEAEERRQKQQEEASERAEGKAVAAHWESLSSQEQADLQAQADAQADPADLARETGPFKRMGQQIRRNEYIRHLLRNRETAPAEG